MACVVLLVAFRRVLTGEDEALAAPAVQESGWLRVDSICSRDLVYAGAVAVVAPSSGGQVQVLYGRSVLMDTGKLSLPPSPCPAPPISVGVNPWTERRQKLPYC